MKKFALIGASGYIAPRHMKAIKETNNQLVAALDPFDSVGIIDSFFPSASFFTEFERFDRHIEMIRREQPNEAINYVSVCSPNYLHDSHTRFALRVGADAICEKPLVLNPWNLDGLKQIEEEHQHKIYTILQLRVHPSIVELKNSIASQSKNSKYEVDLTYITSRGKWCLASWKGDEKKSGGIATNIGVHFYDLLAYLFGDVQQNKVHIRTDTKASVLLEFQNARVRWFLSIDANDLPEQVKGKQTTYRSIKIEDEEIEFSGGFADLHTKSYEEIMNGNGFEIEDARTAIEIVSQIRTLSLTSISGDYHPYVRNLL